MIPDFDEKLALVQQRYDAQTKGILAKKTETECEQAFNDDIFKQVLGYISFPSSPFTIDPKGKTQATGQKPDAILWYYDPEKENSHSKTQVVVEIKDAKTPLDKSQRREWNLSPIQQWFKYKPQYSNCKWVIATNFIEIRLFKDNQLDYEIWTLEDLVNPENDYYQLKRFYYLLNADNLISKSGASRTEKLLSEVRIEQEQITKKFYKEYKQLRLELINDMRANNPDVDLEVVIEKAQKVIDRLIFVHFCEDLWLLPEHKLKQYIERAGEFDFTPWEIIKKVFKWVDKWSDKLEIPKPWYNGGLFHQDPILDDMEIWDEVCHKFVDLWVYDFAEDLSVNILWHIFEQSISDLEELKIDLLWTELETWELGESTTKTSKRKKDGIFYTPEYIVDYIVKNSLWTWLEEQFEILKKTKFKQSKKMKDETFVAKEKELYVAYQQILQNIKVLDPACGSGAFLVKVFDYLLEENVRVMNVLSDGQEWLFDPYDMAKGILTNNIYGVDLNAESVEITKLSLWLKTAQKGKKLADLADNIKCGNSLIDDPEVAGEKAFRWEKEFADIISEWGFDVVVGNPPYVRHELLWKENKAYYSQKYIDVYNWIADLYVYFYEKSLNVVWQWWRLWFITPNKWLERKYGKELRTFLLDYNVCELINYGELKVFDDASTEPVIIIIEKSRYKKKTRYAEIFTLDEAKNTSTYTFDVYDLKIYNEKIRKFIPSNIQSIIDKFNGSNFETLEAYTSNGIYYWVKTWLNEAFIIDKDSAKELLSQDQKNKEIVRKMVEGDDFWKWHINWKWRHILATWYDLDIPNKYPAIQERLLQFSPKVEKRYDQWQNRRNLRACDYYDKFDVPKLIYYHTAKDHSFYYDTENYYISANCYIIPDADRYLQCLLNSSLFQFVKKFLFPAFWNANNGWRVRLDANKMRKVKIKSTTEQHKIKFAEIAERISHLSQDFYDSLNVSLELIQGKYWLDKVSKKLQSFYELEFPEFKKQLKIKKLSLEDEEELLSYFTKKKTYLLELKAKIDATDREIDEMVFDLYGLTDEERKIVLDS